MIKQRIVPLMLSFLGSLVYFLTLFLFKSFVLVFTICIEVMEMRRGDRKSTRHLM